MMLVMVKEADRNRVEVPGDYEVLDPTEDHDVVQWTLLLLRVKGPGGFSRRDWYSSRAFNRLPPGPVVPRQTPQDGEAAYCLGCCLLSYGANGEPNSSSEGVMCLWILYLGQAFLLTAHPSIAISPMLSMWSRVSRYP
jgi:hypothetical protein